MGKPSSTAKDLDRIFKVCRTVTLKDRDADLDKDAFEPCDLNRKVTGVAKKMVKEPHRWGVVVSDFEYYGYLRAADWAKGLFALDVVPYGIDHIACLGSNHYNAKTAAILKEAGITVVLDATGSTPYPTPSDDLVHIDKSDFYERLLYTGKIPKDILNLMNINRKVERDIAVLERFNDRFDAYSEDKHSDLDPNVLIETFTYGRYEMPAIETVYGLHPKSWIAAATSHIRFDDYDYEDAAFYEDMGKLKSAMLIWHRRMEDARLKLDFYRHVTDETIRTLADVGRALGIDRDIDALYAGVPVEDILAA